MLLLDKRCAGIRQNQNLQLAKRKLLHSFHVYARSFSNRVLHVVKPKHRCDLNMRMIEIYSTSSIVSDGYPYSPCIKAIDQKANINEER